MIGLVKCSFFNRGTSESNLLSVVYVSPEYSSMQNDILLCSDCASLAKQACSIAYAEKERIENIVKENIQQYKNSTRNQIIQLQRQSKNQIFKDLLENLIIRTDEIESYASDKEFFYRM